MKTEAKNIQEWQAYINNFIKTQIDPFIKENLGYLPDETKHRIKRQIVAYLLQCDVAHKDPEAKEITKIVNKEAGTNFTA